MSTTWKSKRFFFHHTILQAFYITFFVKFFSQLRSSLLQEHEEPATRMFWECFYTTKTLFLLNIFAFVLRSLIKNIQKTYLFFFPATIFGFSGGFWKSFFQLCKGVGGRKKRRVWISNNLILNTPTDKKIAKASKCNYFTKFSKRILLLLEEKRAGFLFFSAKTLLHLFEHERGSPCSLRSLFCNCNRTNTPLTEKGVCLCLLSENLVM